jgi:leader peptidase (prepilin peptidase)/N-methyltransferase
MAMRIAVAAALGGVTGVLLRMLIERLAPGGAAPGLARPLGPIVRARAIELTTALMFALGCWDYGVEALTVSRLVLGCALIVLFAVDLDRRVLPNVVTVPGLLLGLAFALVTEPGWLSALAGVFVGGGALLLVSELYVRVRGEDGLGMGDVKMLAMIGAFLGWKLTIVALMVASFGSTLVGVGLILSGRGGTKSELPFGAFLAVGAVTAATTGQTILAWYLGRL